MDGSSLAFFVKNKRADLDMTQIEFAKRFNLSLRALRSIEQGNTNVLFNHIEKILLTLGYEFIPSELRYRQIQTQTNSLNSKEVLSILRTYLPVFRKVFHVEKIGIFGSVARGEQETDSDIDIYVRYKNPVTLAKESKLVEFLKRVLNFNRLDIIVAHRIGEGFEEEIQKDLMYA